MVLVLSGEEERVARPQGLGSKADSIEHADYVLFYSNYKGAPYLIESTYLKTLYKLSLRYHGIGS